MIDKIKRNVDKINTTIDNQGSHGYYLIDEIDNDVKLLSKNHDKNEAEKEALNKLTGKDRFIDSSVFYVNIFIDDEFIGKSHTFISPVSLKIKEFHLSKTFKLKFNADNKFGAVWYTNDDLHNGAFRFKDIKQIIFNIHHYDINIINIGGVRAVDVLKYSDHKKKKN